MCSTSANSALLSILLLASCAKHYRVDGMVLRVDAAKQTMVVSHRDIEGFMPAMVMPFNVRNRAELAGLEPGGRIAFQLAVTHRSAFARHIERRGTIPAVTANAKAPVPAPEGKIQLHSSVPDFSLIDQSGRPLRLSDFAGRVVALDFLYTRCPLPDVCPRLAANFARLQRRFAAQLGTGLVLLSITIDPQYDTPAVLAKYAKLWKADPAGWHFLTGSPEDIRRVAARFGMLYWPEEGSMTHTSQTCIIARNGTLAAVVDGPAYAVSQLGDLIASQLETP